MFLDTFRIIEKTTVSNEKRYIPQVLWVKNKTKGFLWWSKDIEVDLWLNLYRRLDGFLFYSFSDKQLIYDSELAARSAINQFKIDIEIISNIENYNTFKDDKDKIINI